MSQPPTPQPVPSDGDRERAKRLLRHFGLAANSSTTAFAAREFAAARFEELSAGDPRDLPLEPLPLDAQQAVALIRRVAATLRRPGELDSGLLPMGDRDSVRVTSVPEVEQWLGGLAERVLYGGIEQLAEDQ